MGSRKQKMGRAVDQAPSGIGALLAKRSWEVWRGRGRGGMAGEMARYFRDL